MTAASPSYATRILEAHERGATDDELQPLLAEAITESRLREGGDHPDGPARGFPRH